MVAPVWQQSARPSKNLFSNAMKCGVDRIIDRCSRRKATGVPPPGGRPRPGSFPRVGDRCAAALGWDSMFWHGPQPAASYTHGVEMAPQSKLDQVISLAKRRGFVFQAGEIY